jgi:3-dehydroquinate dehydratase
VVAAIETLTAASNEIDKVIHSKHNFEKLLEIQGSLVSTKMVTG